MGRMLTATIITLPTHTATLVFASGYWSDGDADDTYGGNYYNRAGMGYNDGDADDGASYHNTYGYASPNYYNSPNYYDSQNYYDPNYGTYSDPDYGTYSSYYDPNYTAYGPSYGNYIGANVQQAITGLIIARNGSNLVVLTPSFTPMIIDATNAMNYGNTNGPLIAGRWITAYGYSANNTFMATALT